MPQDPGLQQIVQRMIDAGESEENIATVIKGYQAPKAKSLIENVSDVVLPHTPIPAIRNITRNLTASTPRARGSAGAMVGSALLPAAAMLLAPETGGLSLAALGVAGAGAGGMMGASSVGADTRQAAIEGLKQGALQLPFAGMGATAAPLERGAESLWLRLAKPKASTIARTMGFKTGGQEAGRREIAQTVLGENLGTIRGGNVAKMQTKLDDLDTALNQAIQSSSATVPRQVLEDALAEESTRVGHGTLGQRTQQSALNDAFDELSKLPQNIPVQQAQAIKQQIYKTRNYAGNAADSAQAAADKVTGRALRGGIETAAPEARDINAQFTHLIPAKAALADAAARAGNRDPIGLSQLIFGAARHPITAAGAILNYPSAGSFAAQRMYNAAKTLPALQANAPNLIRAAIIGLLGGSPNEGK